MTRIKIKDLPRDMKVSRDEMKKVTGGYTLWIGRPGSFWPMKTSSFVLSTTLGGPVSHSMVLTGTQDQWSLKD